jgi:hypothetical protein
MLIKLCVSGVAMLAGLGLAGCTEPMTPGSQTTAETQKGASPPAPGR